MGRAKTVRTSIDVMEAFYAGEPEPDWSVRSEELGDGPFSSDVLMTERKWWWDQRRRVYAEVFQAGRVGAATQKGKHEDRWRVVIPMPATRKRTRWG